MCVCARVRVGVRVHECARARVARTRAAHTRPRTWARRPWRGPSVHTRAAPRTALLHLRGVRTCALGVQVRRLIHARTHTHTHTLFGESLGQQIHPSTELACNTNARGPPAQAPAAQPGGSGVAKPPPTAARHTAKWLARCQHAIEPRPRRGELAGASRPTAATAPAAGLIPRTPRPRGDSGGHLHVATGSNRVQRALTAWLHLPRVLA
jgi:hypothetical protein